MGVRVFLMTTATCFIRQEAPECSTASSEMEAIKPAQLNWLCWQHLWSSPQAGGQDFSFLRLNIQLANGAGRLSVFLQRLLQERQRVFTAHCPWQQNKTDCHPRVFLQSFRFGLFHLLPPLSLIFKNRKCLGSTKQVPWQKGSWTLKLNGYFS